MAIGLREFTTPDYASHIPAEDKEERTIQKIEKFATFLNELPWFSKKEVAPSEVKEEGIADNTGVLKKDADEAAQQAMLNGADIGQLARQKAEGAAPLGTSVELQLMRNAKDTDEFAKALEAAELKRIPIDGGNMTARSFVVDKNDPDDVRTWQAKFGMTGKDVDGVWGPKTQKAYEAYISK